MTITGLNLRNSQLRGHGLEIIRGPSGNSTLQHAEVIFKHPRTTSLSATCECNSEAVTVYITAHQLQSMWDNLDVTNGDLGLVVDGQKVTLDAVWQPTTPPGVTYEWTAPEKCVAGYEMKMTPRLLLVVDPEHQYYDTSAKVTQLADVVDPQGVKLIHKQIIDYYPTGVLTNAVVSLKATVPGQKFHLHTEMSVSAPESTFTVTVSNHNPVVHMEGSTLRCGVFPPLGLAGIRYSGSVTLNSTVKGEIGVIQLIKGKSSRGNKPYSDAFSAGFIGERYNSGAKYVLDRDGSTPFYGEGVKTVVAGTTGVVSGKDSPYIEGLAGNTFLGAEQQFRLYLMFRPADGIWVTLRLGQWDWLGHAHKITTVVTNSRGELEDQIAWELLTTSAPGQRNELLHTSSWEGLPAWSERMQDTFIKFNTESTY